MGHPKQNGKSGIGQKKKEHPVFCICKSCCKTVKSPFTWGGTRKQRALKRVSKARRSVEPVYKIVKRLVAQCYSAALGGTVMGWLQREPDHIAGRNGLDFYGVPNYYAPMNLQFLTHEEHEKKTNAVRVRDGISQRHDFRPAKLKRVISEAEERILNRLGETWAATEFRREVVNEMKLGEICGECGSEKGECAKDFEEGEL
jgi:hypothetical protein